MSIRNIFFDMGWLPSYQPKIKTIAIGNLNTGGTGKTPFTELLIRMLSENRSIAVVSRGYGRKTKGFLWVNETSNANDVGDEPLQIKKNFTSVVVAVSEKRLIAIKKIESEHPEVNLIIMDDAFQHRYVRAHVYILLSTYKKPYFNDIVLPTGNLREWKSGVKRADYIVMTKCPVEITPVEKNAFQKKINPKAYQKVYFSHEKYGNIYDMFSEEPVDIQAETVLLVSGIADNGYILNYIENKFENIEAFNLSDHVVYDKSLITRIKKKYSSLSAQFQTCILTTEKDAMKLKSFKNELSDIPVYVIPFEHIIMDASGFLSDMEDKI